MSRDTWFECAVPRFDWRGMHLDVSRHLFEVPVIQRFLERMAFFGFNRFHWHLTDDQGWRLPSRRYPELNRIGSWRTEENGTRYGGFYRPEEIRQVVDHARSLGIVVVPEIDLPGHTQSALAALPELSCLGERVPVWNQWGISPHVLCPGKEAVYQFVETLLEEVAELFPGPWVHIGGDECPTTHWQRCPDCRQWIESEGLDSERALQGFFTRRIGRILARLDKNPVAWDEVLDNDPPEDLTVTIWRGHGRDAIEKATRHNIPFILCPQKVCYFDWHPSANPDEKGGFGITTAGDVLNWDPEEGLPQDSRLLGVQANLWSERICTEEDLVYLSMPRMAALATVCHQPEPEWDDFSGRLRELRHHPMFHRDPPWSPLIPRQKENP